MKELIYFNKRDLKPTGGPRGYLYNLNEQIIKNNNENIEFLDYEMSSKKKKIFKFIEKLPKGLNKKANLYLKHRYAKNVINNVFGDKERKTTVDLNKYDIIHFHDTYSMYMVKDSLKEYKGKVLITSHCPKPCHREIREDHILHEDYLKYKKDYDKLDIIDEYAFNRADYIVFPCEEAEEPYFNQWDKYKEIKKKNKKKYRYILTGTKKCITKETKEEIRKKYNIPNDAFLISYVGRHNEVKGYDDLKEIGSEVLKGKNIYFLIAGKEGPLYKLDNEKWIEVGWTNDPHSIIGASDIFVLPNKETYFDLILLEVLSLGKPVLATYTGGNKYFEKEKCGIEFYKNNKEAVKKLIDFSKNKKELEKLGKLNEKLFEEKFTTEVFYKNYVSLINEIDKEK